MKIDPNNTWRKVEARLARETDPKRRRNLETVLSHMKAEAAGDLEGLMATITTLGTPRYHAYGTEDPLLSPHGHDAVRQSYTAFVASGAVKLELDVQGLAVDEDLVITDPRRGFQRSRAGQNRVHVRQRNHDRSDRA